LPPTINPARGRDASPPFYPDFFPESKAWQRIFAAPGLFSVGSGRGMIPAR
jgi:hypothetical protein